MVSCHGVAHASPGYATVGQGTLGLGVDLVSLSSMIGLFGELGAHIYDSPTHSANGNQCHEYRNLIG